MRIQPAVNAFACLCLALALGACSPTYRQDQLLSAIQEICQREHGFTVSARLSGHTLAIHLRHPDILSRQGDQFSLNESAHKVLGDVIEAVHRVILSSNSTVEFYVVLVSDPAVPGIYLTIVRSMEDIRRANANMLTPTELFHRTILELKSIGAPSINLDQIILNDIQMEQFLSWQLAKRIQTRLTEQLQRHGITKAEVGPCGGEFKNGEFLFTLNVTPTGDAQMDGELMQLIFQEATNVVAHVLSDYRFNQFNAIRFIHPPTGRNLLLPKTRLELFR